MPKEILGEKLYTADELAELLGVTRRTITTYIQKKWIQGQKIGKHWHFSETNVKAFLQGKRPQP